MKYEVIKVAIMLFVESRDDDGKVVNSDWLQQPTSDGRTQPLSLTYNQVSFDKTLAEVATEMEAELKRQENERERDEKLPPKPKRARKKKATAKRGSKKETG